MINKVIIVIMIDFNKFFEELDEQIFGITGNEFIKKNEQVLLTILSLLILTLLIIRIMRSGGSQSGGVAMVGMASNMMSSVRDSVAVNQDVISSIIIEFAMAIFIAIAFLPSLSLLGIILVCIHVIRPKLAYLYSL